MCIRDRILYGAGAYDAATTPTGKCPGSYGHSGAGRRVRPEGGEPLVAPVSAWESCDIQAGGAGHECEGSAVRGCFVWLVHLVCLVESLDWTSRLTEQAR